MRVDVGVAVLVRAVRHKMLRAIWGAGRGTIGKLRLCGRRDGEVVALDDGVQAERGACFGLAVGAVAAVCDHGRSGEGVGDGVADASSAGVFTFGGRGAILTAVLVPIEVMAEEVSRA